LSYILRKIEITLDIDIIFMEYHIRIDI